MTTLAPTCLTRASRAALGRRHYFDSERLDVTKKARPPIFEDVQPFMPPSRAPSKPPLEANRLPPLSAPLDGLPAIDVVVPPRAVPEMSRLPNGVRVVSQQTFGQGFAVVGIAIESGSRFELAAERGASAVANRLTLNVTITFATYDLNHD